MVLRTEPAGDVTVTPSVPGGTDVRVTPERAVFAPGSWEVAQRFTVEALGDDDAAPDGAVTVAHAAAGGGYDTVAVAPVTVEVIEDDAVAVVVAPLIIEVAEGGAGKTYTVVLGSAPTAPVTVRPAGLARADAKVTVTPAAVTFDANNWEEPQEFTVEAPQDADADDALERIAHEVTGGDYEGAAADTVTATVKDDDQPSTEVALSVSPPGVGEGTLNSGGAAVTVTATLDRAPRAAPTAVTVSVGAGSGPSAAEPSDFEAVADFTLTIAANAASATATFTLVPTLDRVDEGDETLRVTGATAAAGLTVTGTDLVLVESDTRGILADPDALSVDEGDTAGATYAVLLSTQPTGTVTVTAVPEPGTDLRVAPATLTFDAAAWGTAKTFTVTALDDADSTADLVATVTHRSSGGGYDGLTGEGPVAVTIVETDVPGVAVRPPAAAVLVEGERHDYRVVLRTRPAGAVTVTPSVPGGAEIAIVPASVTFEPDAWDTARIFTIEVLADDDAVDDGAVAIGHAVAGPGAYAAVTVAPMEVTLADDETAEVLVSPTALAVTENAEASVQVSLASRPTAPVTVTASTTSNAISLPVTTLAFTRSSWAAPQTLAVEGVDDTDSDDETAAISFTATGGDYTGATSASGVTVTVKDDNQPSTEVALSVSPPGVGEGTLNQGGAAVTVTATLDRAPRAAPTAVTVSVGVGSGPSAAEPTDFEAVADFTLTIAANAASGTATFTLVPTLDAVDEGDETLAVTGTAAAGLDVAGTELVIVEGSTRGIFAQPDALSVAEGDPAGATYSVALDTEPTGTVTVTAVPEAGTDVRVSPATLTFDAQDWGTDKTFTVTALDDADSTADLVATITHRSSGGGYSGLSGAAPVAVTVVEDDVPAVTVAPQTLDVTEGESASWTVGLATRPSAPVTVTPVLAVGAEAVVEPAHLEFTADAHWSGLQRFTVTALDDDDAVPDAAFTVGHTVAGGDYDGASAAGVAVRVIEDDAVGLVVAPPALAVAEGDAAGAALTVRLASAPTAPVTVTAALGNALVGKAAVTPASRRFDATDWERPKRFTVTGLADADGDDVAGTVLLSAAGGDYAGASARSAVTVEDDEDASSEVRLTVAPQGVAEDAGPSGAPVTVTAAFDGAPRSTDTLVTISVGAGAGAGAAGIGDFEAVAVFTLTIPARAAQASAGFTLVPVDDDDWEGDETLAVTGTVNAAGLTVAGTVLAIREDDVRGIALSTTALTVVEAGAGVAYEVTLATRPAGPVTVHADAPAGTDVRVAPASLPFSAENWHVAQAFTVSAVDDADGLADPMAAIAHRVAGADYAGVTVADTVAVTIADNDTPAVAVTPRALGVDEGGSARYTVVLTTLPAGDVTVRATVAAGDGDVGVEPPARVFTAQDWYTPQGFTVSHRGDADASDDAPVTVSHSAAGGGYGAVAVAPVAVRFTDADTAGLVFVPAAVTLGEASVATYTVALATRPTAPVDVFPVAEPGSDVTVLPGSLRFTRSSWDEPQTVTVIAGPDSDPDDDRVTVDHRVTGGDYGVWASGAPPAARSLPVTVEDDDMPSTEVRLDVAPARVGEDAGSTTVTVTGVLDGAPLSADAQVRVTVLPGAGAGGAQASDFAAVAPFTLTIGAGTGQATAAFSFTPVDDDVAEGEETVTVGGSVAGLTVVPGAIAIEDDDRRGIVLSRAAVTVTEEDGAGATYTVALTSEPTGTVTVFADAPAMTDVRVAPASLTFGAAHWAVAQVFTVSAVHDADGRDETGLAIAHRVAGADYAGHTVGETVAVTIVDDDIPDIVVSAPPAVELDELEEGENTNYEYTVRLATEPSGPVTVAVTSSAPAALSVAPASLTFGPSDWETAQPVTVTAEHDDDADDATFTITHAAAGGDYAGVTASTDPLTVTVDDDETEGLVVTPAALTVAEEATGTFTVALASAPAGTVEVETAVAGDSDVTVRPAVLTFDAASWETAQSFTVAAGDDADSDNDTATVTVRVKSGGYGAAPETVAVTVDDNDDPSTRVTLIVAPAGVDEDAGARDVTVTGRLDGAPRTDATQVFVTVSAGTAGAGEFEAVSAFALTIAAGVREGTAAFSFEPVDDAVDEDDETVIVDGFTLAAGIAVAPATLAILDDDTRGVRLSRAAVTVTEEDGAGATYTVRLESEPTGPVTVHADAPAGTVVRVMPASVSFTPADWETEQTVTVSAVDDADGMDETGLAIAHRVTGADYQGLAVGDTVAVTVVDDDYPRVVVTPVPGEPTTIDELDGAPGEPVETSYEVVLKTPPTGDVTVTLDVPPELEVIGGTVLTFTPQDWATAQTVTVTAKHDDDARPVGDQTQSFTIGHSAAGGGYDDAPGDTFTVMVDDDEREELVVTPLTLAIHEGADSAAGDVSVRLASEPAGPVRVTMLANTTELATDPETRTFTVSDWGTPKTFRVTAEEDTDSADDTATVVVRVDTRDSALYGAPHVRVAVTVDDNDDPATAVALTVAPAGVAENAGATTVTVTGMLDGAPRGADTQITVSVSAGTGTGAAGTGDFTAVADFTLTIEAGERSGAAAFEFEPVDDDVFEGDETVAVTGTTAGLTVEGAALIIEDEDTRWAEHWQRYLGL